MSSSLLSEEMVGKWVHRTARCCVTANPQVYEGGKMFDGSYMSRPIFVLSVIDEGMYVVSSEFQDVIHFLTHEWMDGAWAEWPQEIPVPEAAKARGD